MSTSTNAPKSINQTYQAKFSSKNVNADYKKISEVAGVISNLTTELGNSLMGKTVSCYDLIETMENPGCTNTKEEKTFAASLKKCLFTLRTMVDASIDAVDRIRQELDDADNGSEMDDCS